MARAVEGASGTHPTRLVHFDWQVPLAPFCQCRHGGRSARGTKVYQYPIPGLRLTPQYSINIMRSFRASPVAQLL